jgi:hypothetical protein
MTYEEAKEIRLVDVNLSKRAEALLVHRLGLNTLADLLSIEREAIKRKPNVGRKTLSDIEDVIEGHGCRWEQFLHKVERPARYTDWGDIRIKAALAAMSCLANDKIVSSFVDIAKSDNTSFSEAAVRYCVRMADDMVEELRKGE